MAIFLVNTAVHCFIFLHHLYALFLSLFVLLRRILWNEGRNCNNYIAK